MGGFAFFLMAVLITVISFGFSEVLQIRRRAQRRDFVDARGPESEGDFAAGLSALSPIGGPFARAFRLAVGRALGIEAACLRATDRMIADLHVLNFDAVELASVLEHAFDVRVRVLDIVRSKTLRDLCRLLHERTLDISDVDPPLHRDPVPKLAQPEPQVIPKTTDGARDA